MTAVVIGIDPRKRSNTALVLDAQENVLARERFVNDRDGYRQLRRFARSWPERTWAVEGARGVGLGLAQRIAGDGERVLNVPARLSARVRALGGSSGRKTDEADAYAVAVAGLRGRNLQVVEPDEVHAVLKLLSDRRRQLVSQRTMAVNRLHQLLAELTLAAPIAGSPPPRPVTSSLRCDRVTRSPSTQTARTRSCQRR